MLMDDVVRASGALREVVPCDKLNIASFGQRGVRRFMCT